MKMKPSKLKKARKKDKLEKLEEEISYYRFASGMRGAPRGTVVAKNKVVWGFPHIKRIFTLEKGIERNIRNDEIYVQEKIDGFNLRIAKVEGRIFAFSRGGFADAFATEKAREMNLEEFFEENPSCVLCGEMIGNTPYTEPTNEYDVKLFVFDIDNGEGKYLPCGKTLKLLRKYEIPEIPLLAKCRKTDIRKLKKLALFLNKSGKEGMVIKAADRRTLVKYVTPNADIEDIASAAGLLFDMPSGFFHQRVVRSSFFMKDFALNRKKYSEKLGKAFYEGVMESLKNIEEGRSIEREYEIRVKDPKIWDKIKEHMSDNVGLELIFKKKEGKRTRIRFLKKYKKSTKKLRSWLNGHAVTD